MFRYLIFFFSQFNNWLEFLIIPSFQPSIRLSRVRICEKYTKIYSQMIIDGPRDADDDGEII